VPENLRESLQERILNGEFREATADPGRHRRDERRQPHAGGARRLRQLEALGLVIMLPTAARFVTIFDRADRGNC